MTKFLLLISVVGFLGVVGCVGDRFDVDRISDDLDVTTGILLPVAHADVSVKDILSNDGDEVVFYYDSDGDERVMIGQDRDSVRALGLNDFVAVDIAGVAFPVPFDQLNSGSISVESALGLTVDHFNLSRLKLKYTIEVEYSNFPAAVSLSIGLPSVLPKGRAITAVLHNGGRNVFSFDGDEFLISGKQIPIALTLMKVNGTDVLPLPGQGSLEIRLSDVEVIGITGSTTGFSLSSDVYNNGIDFSDFNRFKDNIRFTNPRVFFCVTNQTPLQGTISPYMKGSRFDGTSMMLLGQPIVMNDAVNGVSARTVIAYDKSNSNVADFMNFLPAHLSHRGDFTLSMPGSSASVTISQQDSIYFGFKAEIPIEFMLDATINVDTIDIDDTDLFDDIRRGTFEINSENSLPLDASLAIAFYDEDTHSIIDLIVSPHVIPSGKVDSITGKSTAPTVGHERIVLSESNIKNLQKTEKLILQLKVKNAGYDAGQVVVLLANNRIRLEVVLVADVEF